MKHRAEALISANHYDPQSVREIAEEVTKRWQQLVTCAEERHKLVTASINFYKTAEQVSDVYLKSDVSEVIRLERYNFKLTIFWGIFIA